MAMVYQSSRSQLRCLLEVGFVTVTVPNKHIHSWPACASQKFCTCLFLRSYSFLDLSSFITEAGRTGWVLSRLEKEGLKGEVVFVD